MAMSSLKFKIALLQIILHIGQSESSEQSSCMPTREITVSKGYIESKEFEEDMIRFLAEKMKYMDGKNIVIETSVTELETAMPEIHSGPVSDSCKDDNSTGGCFWIEMPGPVSTDFANATQICENHSSVLAVIPNEAVYDDIVTAVRKKSTEFGILNNGTWSAMEVWLGMEIVQNTRAILHPAETYVKWHPNFATAPHGGSNQDASAIVLKMNSRGIGLGYTDPQQRRGGVVCWKPKNT